MEILFGLPVCMEKLNHFCFYMAVTDINHLIRIPKGKIIDVYKTFDNCVVAVYDGKFFETKNAINISEVKPASDKEP